MENLARAYNKSLKGTENPTVSAIIDIVNEQIYLLSRLSICSRVVGYILSLKECVKNELVKNETPSRRNLPKEGGLNRIINLELELLTLLDSLEDVTLTKVREYENRALSLLCYLGK